MTPQSQQSVAVTLPITSNYHQPIAAFKTKLYIHCKKDIIIAFSSSYGLLHLVHVFQQISDSFALNLELELLSVLTNVNSLVIFHLLSLLLSVEQFVAA